MSRVIFFLQPTTKMCRNWKFADELRNFCKENSIPVNCGLSKERHFFNFCNGDKALEDLNRYLSVSEFEVKVEKVSDKEYNLLLEIE